MTIIELKIALDSVLQALGFAGKLEDHTQLTEWITKENITEYTFKFKVKEKKV